MKLVGTGGQTPFVGRLREIDVLHVHLERASQGAGGMVLVAGEPGIGKTRLLFEFGAQARAEGWVVLSGRAYDSDGMPPYLPFVEALRGYVRGCPPGELRAQLEEAAVEVARLVPEIRGKNRVPNLPEGSAVGAEVDRYRLFEGVSDFVLAIAGTAPGPGLLLILDDLHWADEPSLLLLQHLARRLADARLLVAAAYRTVELNRTPPLARLLAELRRESISERLLLPPLPAPDMAAFVEALTDVRPHVDVVDLIGRKTDGNPFFVRELTLHLQSEGFAFQHPESSPRAWSIPDGVRQVIDHRLTQLSPLANRILQAAAVLGDGFSFEVLREMDRTDDATLLDVVDQAVAAGILREDGEGYIFGHALIRDTVYAALSLARRRRLHLHAAEALQSAYPNTLPVHIGDIADHYRLAGPLADRARTIEFAGRAGEAAAAVFAYERAVLYLQTALQLLSEDAAELDQRISLLDRLAVLTRTIGFDQYERAVSYLETALRLCEANGLLDRAALMRCRLGGMLASNTPRMNIPGALVHFRAAELLLQQRPDQQATLGYMYAGQGSAAVWAVDTQTGLDVSQRGMELGAHIGDDANWAYSATNHGWQLISLGHLADGCEFMERAWAAADRLDSTHEAYRATSWLGNRLFLLDDPVAARAVYERELSQPRLAAAPTRHLALVSSMAVVHARSGDLAAARQIVNALGAHAFAQDSAMLAQPMLDFWSGDWAGAEATWTTVREQHRRAGNRWGVADFDMWLAYVRQLQGDAAGAMEDFSEALGIAIDGPIVPLELKARAGLALLALERGTPREARAQLARCAELLTPENWRGLAGHVARAEAATLAAEGITDRAEARFADSIQLWRTLELPWDEAETWLWWGRAVYAAGNPVLAREKLDLALELYARHRAGSPWIERARRALAGSPRGPVELSPAYPDRLSEREVQVLRLIAAGMTNREIAETLCISRHTVERHVNHIFTKTGASNRTQVAGYAHREMLLAR